MKISPDKVYAGDMKTNYCLPSRNKSRVPLASIIYRVLLVLFLLVTSYLLLVTSIHAQTKSVDVTYSYTALDPQAADGDILFSSNQNLNQADTPYSNRIFGVLQKNALIVYRSIDNKGQPVSRTGIAQVNVTTLNGPILKGDYITSSAIPGKGQKASQSGYVLGIALDNFTGEGAQTANIQGHNVAVGKIAVALRIEYAEIDTARSINRLLEYVNSALFKNVQDPEKFIQIVRYISAGLIVLIAFGIGFITFSRAMAKGVEGIGRNPLAKNAIQFSIIINAALTAAIALIGVIASFLILRL